MADLTFAERITRLATSFEIDAKRAELTRLTAASEASDLWQDQERAVQTLSQLTAVRDLVTQYDTVAGLVEMASELDEHDRAAVDRELRLLELQALLTGRHDAEGAILSVHAGTGGTDAQDWAAMLERMFLRYVEQGSTELPEERTLAISRTDWKATVLDATPGEEAGVKSVTVEVRGRYAYGLLKGEAGVHRLVRLSPFNAKNLRQTSFALVEVLPAIPQDSSVQIDEKELRIDVFRSGGHGGQSVNTTDSAVRITHLPTGIVVAVQNERSQHQNKATAMAILRAKLVRLRELENAEAIAVLKGEFKEGSWGNQIRSYVIHPYQLVKDHRTGCETAQVQATLDGYLRPFIEAELAAGVAEVGKTG